MTWKRVRLKDVGIWYGGGTPSKSNASFWTGGDIPWLSPKDMGPDVLAGTIDHVTSAAVSGSSTKLVPADSVAVVTRSGILERTIPVAVVPFETTMNQDMKAVVPHEGIDPRWIAWGLRANERELLRETRKAGTTVASIEMPRFYDFELPIPELDEQRRIVAILEDHLSRLDAADASLNSAVRRLETLGAASLAELVVPPIARPLFGTDPAILGGDKEPPMPLPDGWRWARWSEIGTSQNGKAFPSKDYQATGLRLLRPGNLGADGRLRWNQRNTKCLPQTYAASHAGSLLNQGDIVMNLTAQSLKDDFLGRVCMVGKGDEALLNQRIARLAAVGVDAGFAMAVFKSRLFRHYVKALSTGSLIQHMFTTQVNRFWMPIPSASVQMKIATAASQLDGDLAQRRAVVLKQSARVEALRRSLLTAALSGRLTRSRAEALSGEMIKA